MDRINRNKKRLNELEINTKVKNNDIPEWKYSWNFLMLNYGFIPKKRFLELDAQDIEDLIDIIVELKERGSKK